VKALHELVSQVERIIQVKYNQFGTNLGSQFSNFDIGVLMEPTGWSWANLSEDQVSLVAEAEQTLGADYMLAYQSSERDASRNIRYFIQDLQLASLDESQLDCLQGLEKRLQAVVIAYKRM
jgi:hypothetical protein